MEVSRKVTSKVYLIRHGETDWSKGGKHTSRAEVPLSKAGEEQVIRARDHFVGEGKLIDPSEISRIYCSPRGRARRTCELLNLGHHGRLLWQEETPETPGRTNLQTKVGTPVLVTDRLKEWDYGDYEGMTIDEVHELRKKRGLDRDRENDGKTWNIWVDGCEGGESPNQVSDRLDSLISEILKFMETAGPTPGGETIPRPKNIVCIAHGHVLASFALRWAQQPLKNGMRLLMETAGVAVLGFEHDDVREPGIILGRRAGL